MIVIVDYGFGNKINLSSALDKIKVDHLISSKKKDIENCSHLILPGVGAFKTTINCLKKKKLLNTIKDIAKKKPVLGICLGMQLLFDYSVENGKTGARALRSIIEELMLDIMYTLPSEENVKEFTITKKMVDNLFSSKIVKLPSGSKRIIKESA